MITGAKQLLLLLVKGGSIHVAVFGLFYLTGDRRFQELIL